MPTPYYPSRWLISPADAVDDPDVFPLMVGQQFLQLKTPVWSTDIKTSVSGRERRRALWSYPIWKFKVGYDVLRDQAQYPAAPDIQRLIAFFNAHNGAYQEFLYNDRTDNMVTNQALGLGDGVKASFQLTRTITVGGISATEPVFAVNGAPTVTVDGVATAVTVGARGLITFASPPGAGAVLRWSGSFFFVCRFSDDQLDIEQMMSGLWSSSGIEFRSVKA